MPNVQLNMREDRQSIPSNRLTPSVANQNKHHSVDHDHRKCEETINSHHLQMVLNKQAIYKFV